MRLALIDTDCVIYALTAQFPALRARLEDREPGTVAISSINFAEIALGTANGKLPSPAMLDRFVAVIPVLPFDEAAARAYATLPFKRAKLDCLLAAHALSLDAIVVTNNGGDYADIPNLRVENWTV